MSVILPVRDGARYLGEALESVRAQTYRTYELIVVDGDSIDGSDVIAESFRPDRLIRQSRPGLWAALNIGIQASRGEYLAFISCDDCWSPDKLAQQAACLDQQPEVQMVIADVVFFVADGCAAPPGFRERLLDVPHPLRQFEVMMTRRTLFARVGPLNESLLHGADTDWFARAQDAGESLVALPGVMLYKRLHDRNLSMSAPLEHQRFLLDILRRSLARKRTLGTPD